MRNFTVASSLFAWLYSVTITVRTDTNAGLRHLLLHPKLKQVINDIAVGNVLGSQWWDSLHLGKDTTNNSGNVD